MTMWLKQSTSVVISYGPFLDKTDANTLETGLVSAIDHATTGIKCSKNGGALTIRSQAVTASTYDGYGNYLVTLSTTDTNTLGTLRVQYVDNNTTTLPHWQDFMVVPANIWDSLFGADFLQIDAAQWLGQTIAAVDATGYPKVTIKDGSAQGEILTTSGKVDGVILSDTVTTYTGNTVQTGDSYAKVNDGTIGLSAIKGFVDDIGVAGAGLTAIPIGVTSLTEAYAVDGAAATLAQILYMIWARLAESSVAGVTLTAKKLDGATSAMTFTLNDGTTPTSITRAS